MESIYTELALYKSKHECARTDNVFSTISEVCDGTVSLRPLGDDIYKTRLCIFFFFKNPILCVNEKIFKKCLIKFSLKPPNLAGEVSVKMDSSEALESEINKGFKGEKKIL